MDKPHMQPFVSPVDPVVPERVGTMDVYRPPSGRDTPSPVVVFVHGGPLPAELVPTPRDWPVYIGYGSLAARSGAIGVTIDHGLHASELYPKAAATIAAAVDGARALPDADPHRVVLWFFSGGGLLMADWLAAPPPWLRGVAATYPMLAPLSGMNVDPRFRPTTSLPRSGKLPILLTRVGKEDPGIANTVAEFVSAAAENRSDLDVIDVPEGQHGFDMLDHMDSSRHAVDSAMAWAASKLGSR